MTARTPALVAAAMIFAMFGSHVASELLAGQADWLRVTGRMVTAGLLGALFFLVASRLTNGRQVPRV